MHLPDVSRWRIVCRHVFPVRVECGRAYLLWESSDPAVRKKEMMCSDLHMFLEVCVGLFLHAWDASCQIARYLGGATLRITAPVCLGQTTF